MHQATLQVAGGERPRVTCHTAATPAVSRRKNPTNGWTSHALFPYSNLATTNAKTYSEVVCFLWKVAEIPPILSLCRNLQDASLPIAAPPPRWSQENKCLTCKGSVICRWFSRVDPKKHWLCHKSMAKKRKVFTAGSKKSPWLCFDPRLRRVCLMGYIHVYTGLMVINNQIWVHPFSHSECFLQKETAEDIWGASPPASASCLAHCAKVAPSICSLPWPHPNQFIQIPT